jgi:predicted deacylase
VLEMLDGELEGEPARTHLLGAGDTDKALTTTASGFWLPERRLLEQVEEGDVLGRVYDLAGTVLEEVRAPSAGCVVMRKLIPTVHAGKVVCMLTGYE